MLFVSLRCVRSTRVHFPCITTHCNEDEMTIWACSGIMRVWFFEDEPSERAEKTRITENTMKSEWWWWWLLWKIMYETGQLRHHVFYDRLWLKIIYSFTTLYLLFDPLYLILRCFFKIRRTKKNNLYMHSTRSRYRLYIVIDIDCTMKL